ncbi:Pogo transposable element protein [Mycena sanguinolenta]|uniref:Pogo transposable element protein n=1 Tax=Mycena sanguinolenta TaxID=230812 RepID=A0A8H7D0L4_9AGAR|nr:Pogo transposable element protein [Mycena sanguinolenta]
MALLRTLKPIPILTALIVGVCLVLALPASVHNITVSVPDGTTIQGDSFCKPATPFDILVFYLANYFAHAVTIKSDPGEKGIAKYLSYAAALFFPVSGLMRGLSTIVRRGRFTHGALTQAARSGALCMVVRNEEWEPEDGFQATHIRLKRRVKVTGFLSVPPVSEIVKMFSGWSTYVSTQQERNAWNSTHLFDRSLDSNEWADLQTNSTVMTTYIPMYARESSLFWSFQDTIAFYVNRSLRKIHGVHRLPRGYSFAHVPADAILEPLVPDVKLVISSQSDESAAPKAIAALVQGIYSAFTLYRTQGEQIHRYGFAAFGLTVLPYTIMTFQPSWNRADARLLLPLCRGL